MKRLKSTSLFKITSLIIINVLTQNIIVLVLSLIVFLVLNYKDFLVFILILLLIYISNIKSDFIHYGIVKEVNSSNVIIEKFFYRVKLTSYSRLEEGDVVRFDFKGVKNTNDYELKKNILFTYSSTCDILFRIKSRNYIENRFNLFDETTSNYLKKIIKNEYNDSLNINSFTYGFCFYYILAILLKKDRRICISSLFLYILLFGFELKLYLIMIDIILSYFSFKNIDRLCIKLLLMLFVNYNLISNYSVLLTLIFGFVFINDTKYNKTIVTLIQSILFNNIDLLSIFFYKYLISIRIVIFAFSIVTLFVNQLEPFYINVITLLSKIFDFLSIGVRGSISIISLFIFIILSSVFKNDYLRVLIIYLLLISPVQNPFVHVKFINVGQGDASLIRGKFNSYSILIDTGSSYNYSKLKKELFKEGIYDIDYLIITHNDSDHSGNVSNLTKDFNVHKIVNTGRNIELENINLKYLSLGVYDNDNDNSLVFLLDIDGYLILYTGDISSNIENEIIKKHNINDVDLLKVSHHGSNSASSKFFIGCIKPEIAVISTSGAYNHPSSEVIENLNAYLVKTFITKTSGTISLYFTNLFDFLITNKNEFVIIR